MDGKGFAFICSKICRWESIAHPVPTALNSTTGRGPTVKTNSQKAKKGLPHGELQRIINFQGVRKRYTVLRIIIHVFVLLWV